MRGINRNVQYVTDLLSDRPIDAYAYTDATALRDKLIVVMMRMICVCLYTFSVALAWGLEKPCRQFDGPLTVYLETTLYPHDLIVVQLVMPTLL